MGCAVVSAVAPPAAVPLGREPQMRVLVQELNFTDVHAMNKNGHTAMHMASIGGYVEAMRVLVLAAGPDVVYHRDTHGNT